jgi:hypothetical protein
LLKQPIETVEGLKVSCQALDVASSRTCEEKTRGFGLATAKSKRQLDQDVRRL